MRQPEIITLSDGDIEALNHGETVGPWLLQDVTVKLRIDSGENSQQCSIGK